MNANLRLIFISLDNLRIQVLDWDDKPGSIFKFAIESSRFENMSEADRISLVKTMLNNHWPAGISMYRLDILAYSPSESEDLKRYRVDLFAE